MATRRKARKSTKAPRRRRMNSARPARRRSRRRMNGVKSDTVEVVKMAVGAMVGGVVIGMASKVAPNYYVRAGGAAVLGLMLGKVSPQLSSVGKGMAVAGVAGAGMKALSEANLLPMGTLNGAKRLTPQQMRELTAKLKAAGKLNRAPDTVNGAPYASETLNETRSLVIS